MDSERYGAGEVKGAVVKFRKITGDEKDKLLTSRKPSGFNYQPYFDVLDTGDVGEVIAVEVGQGSERGEKIRFSRAARLRDKSLTWLSSSNKNEITFQIGPPKPQRSRAKKSQ
jgi:hypothetical protein